MEALRTGALVRFHLATGGRLAMRSGALVIGAFVVAVGMSADPSEALRAGAAGLASARGSGGVLFGLAAALVACAGWARGQLLPGAEGWFRHLPASRGEVRRAIVASLVAVQLPVLLLAALLWAVAWWSAGTGAGTGAGAGAVAGMGAGAGAGAGARAAAGGAASLARLAALPVAGLAAAVLVLPVRRRWLTAPAGAVALAGALSGRWAALGGALVLLVVADLFAGGVGERARGGLWRGDSGGGRGADVPAPLVPAAIAVRALGWHIAAAWLVALVPLAAAFAFVRNNTVEPWIATAAVRLGSGLAIAVVLARIAAGLALERPPWPWARSLPWTSAARARWDAIVAGACALPVLAFPALLDPRALLPLVVSIPFLALCAAEGTHWHRAARTGPEGPILVELALVAAWLGVTPWTSLVCLALVLPAMRLAASAERRLAASVERRLEPR